MQKSLISTTVREDASEVVELARKMEAEHGFDNAWLHVFSETVRYFGSRGHSPVLIHGMLDTATENAD